MLTARRDHERGAAERKTSARGGVALLVRHDGKALEQSYRLCRRLCRAHAASYYWAATLLPPERRRHAHALYAFCRYADDIVDGEGSLQEKSASLSELTGGFFSALSAGESRDPLLMAVVHTASSVGIEEGCFRRFLGSMEMDLRLRRYSTFDDLLAYMDGSAAAVGEMMLPVLGAKSASALEPARHLGIAFQLTNFCRDVAEDLDRGRVYLPEEDIEVFGARPSLEERRVTEEWRALMAHEIERARGFYRSAEQGIALLPGRSARCVATAHRLYSGILDRIEAAGYDVFSGRAKVPAWRKAAVAAQELLRPC